MGYSVLSIIEDSVKKRVVYCCREVAREAGHYIAVLHVHQGARRALRSLITYGNLTAIS